MSLLQVKLLQELCTKQAEGRMSVVVISDQEKFRYHLFFHHLTAAKPQVQRELF